MAEEATHDNLRANFLETDLFVDLGVSGWVPIEAALDLLPTPVHVITAWNPFSVELPIAENIERNSRLAERLEELPLLMFPAIGQGSTSTWSEDSIAVIGLDRHDALELGREFEQHAIFEVTDDDLRVLGCFDSWEDHRPLDRSGPQIGGEDGSDSQVVDDLEGEPSGDTASGTESPSNRVDLPGVIRQTLGVDVQSSFVRARYLGWEHEGRFGSPCPTCSGGLDLFGCTSESRAQELVRLMAFACQDCESVIWPHEVPAEVRECAKAWRKLSVARTFHTEQGSQEPYSVYVIELEGEVDERPANALSELPWVYVGQSAKAPEDRFVQHLEGYKSSKWVRRFGSHLRPDLYEVIPVLTTRLEALAAEAWLAASLRSMGFPVKGGH